LHTSNQRPRSRITRPLLAVAAIAALSLTGCVTAAIAGGVFVVGIGSAIIFSGCDEPASVQVWDNTSAYPTCDAVVTAESETGSTATFSPCYQAYLGTGVWHVTATKPGFPAAKGVITVEEKRKCSEPIFHALDLTLGSDATYTPAPVPSPPPSPPPATSPAPSPSPAPAPAPAPPPATTSTSTPSAAPPSTAFPTSTPQEVPAPPTR
jgi:hypothetical protein